MIFLRKVWAKLKGRSRQSELQRLIETDPSQLTAYLELSEMYQDQGRFEDAEKTLQRALEIPLELAEWAKISIRLGWTLFNQEKYDAALDIADSVMTKASEEVGSAEAYYLAGVCYGEKWDPEAESSAHEKYHLACVSNLERALAAAKVLGDHDFQAHVLASLASIKKVERCPERAIKLLQEALGLPGLSLHTLSSCHSQLGCLYDDYYQDYAKAKYHFQQAVEATEQEEDEKSNELSWIYRRLAILHWVLGNVTAAFMSADKALDMVDMSVPSIGRIRKADACRLLGDLSYETDQFDVAVKYYQEYLKLERKDHVGRAKVQTKLGYVFMGKGDYRQAKRHLDAALRSGFVSEERGYLLAQLGHALYQLRDFKQAVQYYSQALKNLRDDDEVRPMVYRSLGHAYFHLQQYAEAARNYREALRLAALSDPIRSELLQYLSYANDRK